ncbi:hypothetical protein [Spirosoma pomorum]
MLNIDPYTYYLVVWLITLGLAVAFGFLLGIILNERRPLQSLQPKRKSTWIRP